VRRGGVVDLAFRLPVEQFHVELESRLEWDAVMDSAPDIRSMADAPVALGDGLGVERRLERMGMVEGVAEVVLRPRAEVRGEGFSVHPNLLIAFAPPRTDPSLVAPIDPGAIIE